MDKSHRHHPGPTRVARAFALVGAALAASTCNLVWQSGDYTFDGPEPCDAASDCPGSDTGCVRRSCDDGACGLSLVPSDTPLPDESQVAGDCGILVCDGAGEARTTVADDDVLDDAVACTDDLCSDGMPSNPPSALGTPCGDGQVCDGVGSCTAAGCIDGELNGDESDVDCGGSCQPCAGGLMCNGPGDCQSGVCVDGHCKYATCIDGVQNGDETDVDCGGDTCSGCADGGACLQPGDCDSGVCDMALCQIPTCMDGVANGSETDVDCGSGCSPCLDGDDCLGGGDCQSGVCALNKCVPTACNDNTLNGDETDVDCGGTQCAPCGDGQSCLVGTDCVNGACQVGFCIAAACGDTLQNGDETDVDCGGSCGPCAVGAGCSVDGDCTTNLCLGATCSPLNGCDPNTAADYTAASEVMVSFQGAGNSYTPPCIRILSGTTVTFVGNFSPHPLEGGRVVGGVTFPDPSSPFWPTTSSGSSKSFVLQQSGQFPYYCTLHAGGGMYGAVFVQ